MPRVENPDHCLTCERPLPEDYVDVTVPASFTVRATVFSEPGVVELRFCCERHRRDWADGRYGLPDDE